MLDLVFLELPQKHASYITRIFLFIIIF